MKVMLPIPSERDFSLIALFTEIRWRALANARVLEGSNKSDQRPRLHFFFALGLAFVGGVAAASRASRSAFRRSRFFENAAWAISCSLIAVAASTWRNALRASRSALVICLGGSISPGAFVIFLPLADRRASL